MQEITALYYRSLTGTDIYGLSSQTAATPITLSILLLNSYAYKRQMGRPTCTAVYVLILYTITSLFKWDFSIFNPKGILQWRLARQCSCCQSWCASTEGNWKHCRWPSTQNHQPDLVLCWWLLLRWFLRRSSLPLLQYPFISLHKW